MQKGKIKLVKLPWESVSLVRDKQCFMLRYFREGCLQHLKGRGTCLDEPGSRSDLIPATEWKTVFQDKAQKAWVKCTLCLGQRVRALFL